MAAGASRSFSSLSSKTISFWGVELKDEYLLEGSWLHAEIELGTTRELDFLKKCVTVAKVTPEIELKVEVWL